MEADNRLILEGGNGVANADAGQVAHFQPSAVSPLDLGAYCLDEVACDLFCCFHDSGDCELVKEILEVIHGAELFSVYHVLEYYSVTVFDVLKDCARGDGVLRCLHDSKVISF